jgi:hypothetical protein
VALQGFTVKLRCSEPSEMRTKICGSELMSRCT